MFTVTADYQSQCQDRDFDSIEAARADFALMMTVARHNADLMSVDLVDDTRGAIVKTWAR